MDEIHEVRHEGSTYGDSVESDTFYGNCMVRLVWRLPVVFMEKTW